MMYSHAMPLLLLEAREQPSKTILSGVITLHHDQKMYEWTQSFSELLFAAFKVIKKLIFSV